MALESVASLASPLTLRGLTLKNRIVISPMCMYSARDGVADDFHIGHLARFAAGGAGLVFVEATAVNPTGRISAGCLGLWNEEQETALARVAVLLRRMGAAAGIQIGHSGRKGSSERPWEGNGPLCNSQTADSAMDWTTVGATTEPTGKGWPQVHALTEDEITRIVQDFGDAAARADRAGFDVLELHCAHGYLVHQFLSPLSNTRTDAYGGSLEGRMRLALEIVENVRRHWPASKPLFARISSVDGIDVGWSIEDSCTLAREMARRGVDAIDCSSGGMKMPRDKQLVSRTPGFQVPFAEAIRRETGIPTIAVGLIRDPAFASAIVAEGKADLVAVAREALVNPNWPIQALMAEGHADWQAWPPQYAWWLERRAAQLA